VSLTRLTPREAIEYLCIGLVLCFLFTNTLGLSIFETSSYLAVFPLVTGVLAWTLSTQRPRYSLRYFLIQLIVTLLLLEGAISILRHIAPTSSVALQLYGGDRNIIQFMPCCARHDASLTYTLKPGEFSFSNKEFDTLYQVNHIGLRDDEESLINPQIIVLGDSQAMGWGVEQNENFAALVEKESGLRVLNTGVSSYGTAREVLMLRRIDSDSAEYFVILYDPTDYHENRKFNEGSGTLETMNKQAYDNIVNDYQRQQLYYPGKYTNALVRRLLFGRLPRTYVPPITSDVHAQEFIDVLINGKVASMNARLIVIGRTEGFITALRNNLRSNDYPQSIENLISLDVSDKLTPKHYFDIDDHMRPLGHRLIADELMQILARSDLYTGPAAR